MEFINVIFSMIYLIPKDLIYRIIQNWIHHSVGKCTLLYKALRLILVYGEPGQPSSLGRPPRHARFRSRRPKPQVTEHSDQAPNSLHSD